METSRLSPSSPEFLESVEPVASPLRIKSGPLQRGTRLVGRPGKTEKACGGLVRFPKFQVSPPGAHRLMP